MIHFPNRVKVKINIEQGCVYNFSPRDSIPNHYYIVLNKNPKESEEIYLAPFTTKKENVLKFITSRRLDKKTFVEIEEGECPFLPRRLKSGVDCNRLLPPISIEDLIMLIDKSDGDCEYPKVNDKLLNRILE